MTVDDDGKICQLLYRNIFLVLTSYASTTCARTFPKADITSDGFGVGTHVI